MSLALKKNDARRWVYCTFEFQNDAQAIFCYEFGITVTIISEKGCRIKNAGLRHVDMSHLCSIEEKKALITLSLNRFPFLNFQFTIIQRLVSLVL